MQFQWKIPIFKLFSWKNRNFLYLKIGLFSFFLDFPKKKLKKSEYFFEKSGFPQKNRFWDDFFVKIVFIFSRFYL